MRKIAEQLYAGMTKDLQNCKSKGLGEENEIENCSQICKNYWQQLQKQLAEYEFKNDEEEIDFFKNIKPLFTSEIEYYNLMYHAQLFKPLIDCEELHRFWLRESMRLERFIDSHHEFYQYYSNKESSRDTIYFIRTTNNHSGISKGEEEEKTATSHDHLLNEMIALEKYNAYVQVQIEKLNNTVKNGS